MTMIFKILEVAKVKTGHYYSHRCTLKLLTYPASFKFVKDLRTTIEVIFEKSGAVFPSNCLKQSTADTHTIDIYPCLYDGKLGVKPLPETVEFFLKPFLKYNLITIEHFNELTRQVQTPIIRHDSLYDDSSSPDDEKEVRAEVKSDERGASPPFSPDYPETYEDDFLRTPSQEAAANPQRERKAPAKKSLAVEVTNLFASPKKTGGGDPPSPKTPTFNNEF